MTYSKIEFLLEFYLAFVYKVRSALAAAARKVGAENVMDRVSIALEEYDAIYAMLMDSGIARAVLMDVLTALQCLRTGQRFGGDRKAGTLARKILKRHAVSDGAITVLANALQGDGWNIVAARRLLQALSCIPTTDTGPEQFVAAMRAFANISAGVVDVVVAACRDVSDAATPTGRLDTDTRAS